MVHDELEFLSWYTTCETQIYKTYQDQITIFVFAESLECIFVVNFDVIFVIFFPNHLQRLKTQLKITGLQSIIEKWSRQNIWKNHFTRCWSLFFEREKISCSLWGKYLYIFETSYSSLFFAHCQEILKVENTRAIVDLIDHVMDLK